MQLQWCSTSQSSPLLEATDMQLWTLLLLLRLIQQTTDTTAHYPPSTDCCCLLRCRSIGRTTVCKWLLSTVTDMTSSTVPAVIHEYVFFLSSLPLPITILYLLMVTGCSSSSCVWVASMHGGTSPVPPPIFTASAVVMSTG